MSGVLLNPLGQPVGEPLVAWTVPRPPPGEALSGRYCRLERLRADRHAAGLHAENLLDADGRDWTYLPYGPFVSGDDYREWMETHCQGGDPLFYVVIAQATGDALGVASYLRITPASGAIEIGHLKFSPRLQRTPAATEALHLLIKHAFSLGYRRLEWKCDALNAASRSAALRLGFRFEGLFRQATVVKGRNRDTAWYALLDRQWPTIDDAFKSWLDPLNFDAAGRQRQSLSAMTRGVAVAGV